MEVYGITKNEFDNLMSRTTISLKARQQKEDAFKWYNGYGSSGSQILNIYSVAKFIKFEEIRSYWKNSGTVEGLNKLFEQKEFRKDVTKLLSKEYG